MDTAGSAAAARRRDWPCSGHAATRSLTALSLRHCQLLILVSAVYVILYYDVHGYEVLSV